MLHQRTPRAEESELHKESKQRGDRLIRKQRKGDFRRKGKCLKVLNDAKVKECKE